MAASSAGPPRAARRKGVAPPLPCEGREGEATSPVFERPGLTSAPRALSPTAAGRSEAVSGSKKPTPPSPHLRPRLCACARPSRAPKPNDASRRAFWEM